MAKTPQDKDTVRKIWLAGIGAYGRALSEAKGAVDSLTGKSSDVFDDLVQKGEMLEAVGKYKAEELIGKGRAAVGDMKPDLEIDERIAKMRARLSSKGDANVDQLAARVTVMEAKLDAILEKLDIGDAPNKPAAKKAATKKSPAKKPAAKATAKTPSKKRAVTDKTPKPPTS